MPTFVPFLAFRIIDPLPGQPFVKFAGAGATIPLTGFGYTLAKGVEKAIGEKGFLGIFTGGLTGAAGGISAAIIFGYIIALIFRPKAKK